MIRSIRGRKSGVGASSLLFLEVEVSLDHPVHILGVEGAFAFLFGLLAHKLCNDLHVYIDLVHTAKIQEVCRNVQTAVKEAIQNMTGRVVTRVDVSVTGIAEPPAPAEHPDVTAAIEP